MKLPIQLPILVIGAIAIVGCSERKNSETESPADKPNSASDNSLSKTHSAPVVRGARKSNAPDERQQYLEFLNEIKSHPDSVVFLESRWSDIWNPTFDELWHAANKKSLSQLINDLESGSEASFNQILKEGKEPWANNQESNKSAVKIASAFAAIFSTPPANDMVSAAEIPRLFGKYRNQMPPTSGDVMICRMVIETSAFFESYPQISEGQLEAWKELASAKNPLYRLLALKVFRKFDAPEKQAQTFYSAYLNETEEGIYRALANALATRDDAWSTETALKVQAKIRQN